MTEKKQLFFNAGLIFSGLDHSINMTAKLKTQETRKGEQAMTEQDKDYLLWKHARGRYSEGGKHYGAKAPQEGGVLSPEYRASTGGKSARAMYRNHSGEPLEADTIPYAPPQMIADPFDKSSKAKAGAVEMEMPEPMMQDAETQDAYTPIACYLEGSPAGSVL